MKEDYGFFNSKDHDRVYNAKDWADYFFPLFKTGVFNGDLQVVENEGMSIKVKPGYAWIDGYKYHLWNEGIWDLEIASGNMNRIDSIVVRLDHTNKWTRTFCKTGSYYAGTAVPPAAEISATMHEIVIAHISVKAGTTRITQDMIKDTRMDKAICGWVCGAVEQIDFSQITAQFDKFFENYRENILDAYNEYVAWQIAKKKQIEEWQASETEETDNWQAEKRAEIDAWKAAEAKQTDDWQQREAEDFDAWVQDFTNKWESWLLGETKGWQEEIIDWFNNLREQLTENAAVSLQEQIGNLNNLEMENKDNLVSAVNSLCMSYDDTMAILAGVKTLKVMVSTNDGTDLTWNPLIMLEYIDADGKYKKVDWKEYTGDDVTFNVYDGMRYRINGSGRSGYNPTRETVYIDKDETVVNIVYRLQSHLSELSWEEIYAIADRGKAGTAFQLYDTKEIELTTGEKVVAMVVGLGQDIPVADAENTSVATFIIRDYLATKYRMNPTNTNAGGWRDSEMRTKFIKENFYDVLPRDLKDRIKLVYKKTSAGGRSASIVTTEDYVWLPSPIEIGFNNSIDTYTKEGTTYTAFIERGENIAKQLRSKRSTEGGNNGAYFLRSPDVEYNTRFKMVGVDRSGYGIESSADASIEAGMAVGFCL